ncbi:putative bifunctional diguanylate cyclase/phosphodiesterase [Acanthopleuribacter pedis]|uniref:EAL domain-containing protein n=1 Tax=Acanthopleuribacter pedis TaxID=442870 RepID=A0A8J7QED4_9BACT|nr:EAL domain-containing protein [Acanthopleuribacter pedis]MBO1318140.1 EAL domain-containing protein [Acanthopleuribacter pedis]
MLWRSISKKTLLLLLLLVSFPFIELAISRHHGPKLSDTMSHTLTQKRQWNDILNRISDNAAQMELHYRHALHHGDKDTAEEARDFFTKMDAASVELNQITPMPELRRFRDAARRYNDMNREMVLRLQEVRARDVVPREQETALVEAQTRYEREHRAWLEARNAFMDAQRRAFQKEVGNWTTKIGLLEQGAATLWFRSLIFLSLLTMVSFVVFQVRRAKLLAANQALEADLARQNDTLQETNRRLESEIEERNLAEWEVRKRLHMEETLGKASGMLTLPHAPRFDSFLELLAEVMSVDHAFIALFKKGKLEIANTFQWHAPEANGEAAVKAFIGLELIHFPWWYERVRANEPLAAESLRDLPESADAERTFFSEIGFKAFLFLPVRTVDDETIGFIGFFDMQNEQTWPSTGIRMLFFVSELLANYFARQKAEDQLRHDAFYDRLTDLPNRILFKNRLEHAIQKCKRYHEYNFAVLFLDLDRFKAVNDTMGHLVGDQLLIEVSDRLNETVRPGDTVARLSGDEFSILLENIMEIEEVIRVVQRIEVSIKEPFHLKGKEVHISCSIGLTQGNLDYKSAEAVIRDADIAMYRAKTLGKARYAVFDKEMHEKAVSAMDIESSLRTAIERDEFELYYQPILSSETDRVIGAEALIRWRKSDGGMISPGEFIPIAEETGLILPIGEWALRTACRQAVVWRDMGLPEITVAVNISARQLQRQDLAHVTQALLEEAGLEARLLKIELTESAVMADVDHAIAIFKDLERMNIKISVDDFGTGYSSLAYLKRFPIHTLKIDRSFINGILDNEDDRAIIGSIIAMAHSLNLRLVAEGVETEAQYELLGKLGCDEIQGYYCSPPVPAADFVAYVQKNHELQPANNTPRGQPVSEAADTQ